MAAPTRPRRHFAKISGGSIQRFPTTYRAHRIDAQHFSTHIFDLWLLGFVEVGESFARTVRGHVGKFTIILIVGNQRQTCRAACGGKCAVGKIDIVFNKTCDGVECHWVHRYGRQRQHLLNGCADLLTRDGEMDLSVHVTSARIMTDKKSESSGARSKSSTASGDCFGSSSSK